MIKLFAMIVTCGVICGCPDSGFDKLEEELRCGWIDKYHACFCVAWADRAGPSAFVAPDKVCGK